MSAIVLAGSIRSQTQLAASYITTRAASQILSDRSEVLQQCQSTAVSGVGAGFGDCQLLASSVRGMLLDRCGTIAVRSSCLRSVLALTAGNLHTKVQKLVGII